MALSLYFLKLTILQDREGGTIDKSSVSLYFHFVPFFIIIIIILVFSMIICTIIIDLKIQSRVEPPRS